MTPLYTHDCEHCVFLGTFDVADLYFCTQELVGDKAFKTVIARHGSDEADYISGLALAHINRHLAEAKRLAEARGLL